MTLFIKNSNYTQIKFINNYNNISKLHFLIVSQMCSLKTIKLSFRLVYFFALIDKSKFYGPYFRPLFLTILASLFPRNSHQEDSGRNLETL
jgi:hypothetical protein